MDHFWTTLRFFVRWDRCFGFFFLIWNSVDSWGWGSPWYCPLPPSAPFSSSPSLSSSCWKYFASSFYETKMENYLSFSYISWTFAWISSSRFPTWEKKLLDICSQKDIINFNPSCHFFQVNMKRTRKKHSQPPPVSFSSLEVSFQSSAVVDSRSQRDAWPEFASSWKFGSTYWALDHQNRIELISLRWN